MLDSLKLAHDFSLRPGRVTVEELETFRRTVMDDLVRIGVQETDAFTLVDGLLQAGQSRGWQNCWNKLTKEN